MTTYFKLDAEVIIDGLDVSAYVMQISRKQDVCNIVQSVTIEFDKTLLDYLSDNSKTLIPSLSATVREFNKLVITGNVRTIDFARSPDYRISIEILDKYKFVKDYFIDEGFAVTNGESVIYWATRILNSCGLSVIVDSSEIATRTVPPGIEIKLRSADDALVEILAYASAFVYCDENGTAHIRKGALSSNINFSGVSDTNDITDPANLIGHNVTKGTHILGDDNTRNVVKVWGYKGDNVILREGDSPYITSEVFTDLGLPVDKTVIYSSNYIQTQAEADRLSAQIADDLSRLDSVKKVEVQGNPDIKIGRVAHVNLNLETETLIGNYTITNVDSDLSKDGYTMSVTMDQFCPRFAGWSFATPSPILYAGTTKYGVYKSLDLGATWTEYNSGLTVSSKNVKSLAATDQDEVMAIINGQLWVNVSGVWNRLYLPVPINTAGDSPAPSYGSLVTVDSDGTAGYFNVLTTYRSTGYMIPIIVSGVYQLPIQSKNRSWVYSTSDTGATWTSVQIKKDDDIPDYNFGGQDLSSTYAIPYVTCGRSYEDYNGLIAIKSPIIQTVWYADTYTYLGGPYFGTFDPVWNPHNGFYFGIVEWDFKRKIDGAVDMLVTGTSPNRVLMLNIVGKDISGWPRSLSWTADEPPEPPIGCTASKTHTLYYLAQSGGQMINNFPSVETWQCSTSSPSTGETPELATFYPTFRLFLNERDLGQSFWFDFSFLSTYNVSVPSVKQPILDYKVYSGESKPWLLYHEVYPYTYWPHYDGGVLTNDLYPLTLGAGTIQYTFPD